MAAQNNPRDFILTTSRTTVTINFTNDTVTLSGSTRAWPLTTITKIIGNYNFVRVKRTPDIAVEIIKGPAAFAVPPPAPETGKRYVYVEGIRNRFKNILERPNPRQPINPNP